MKKYNGMTIQEWAKEAAMAIMIVATGIGLIWLCAAADAALRS